MVNVWHTHPLLYFSTLLIVAVLCSGFSEEARVWQEHVNGFFEAGDTGGGCQKVESALESWMAENADDAVDATSTLVKQIDQIQTSDGLTQADIWQDALYADLASSDGFNSLLRCTEERPRISQLIEDFDQAIASPVSVAIERARKRIVNVGTRSREARMDVARLSLDTVERTVQRYREVVEYYTGDCTVLARNLDQWHLSYYRLVDQPILDFTTEAKQMSAEQLSGFKDRVSAITNIDDATQKATACLDELEGSTRDTLSTQTALLLLSIDSLERAVP